MNSLSFSGPFRLWLKDFIDQKRALGYRYDTEAQHLKRFDAFTTEKYSSTGTLTKEIVLGWCTQTSYEKQSNLCARASMIRQFAIYLDNLGLCAYIIPKNYFGKGEKYMPYIYSRTELERFFSETDRCHFTSQSPYRHLIMPVLFRMLYSCGLRLSEAGGLQVADVDLEKGILTINQSKRDNSRLVPMTNELTRMCQNYAYQVHSNSDAGPYFFPNAKKVPITLQNIYRNFRKFLWRAGISHGGRGVGPRIHDFRFTYCVHCLKKWTEEQKDLLAYLPVLRTYLGHASFYETAYYIKLTADVFPDITLKLERAYVDLIPLIEGGEDETN